MAESFHNSCHPFVSLVDQETHTENAQDKTGQELVNRLNSLKDTVKLDYSVDEPSSFNISFNLSQVIVIETWQQSLLCGSVLHTLFLILAINKNNIT